MRIEENVINVIFDAAKGEVSTPSREAVSGAPIGALPRPVRSGYAFEGWYWNGQPVTEETVITAEEDIRLVAHWVKKKRETKKNSMYRRQKVAVAILSAVTAFLIVALLVVNHIVAIYGLTDVYVEDGVKYTEKYYVRKKDGAYALYDKKGNKMEVNSDGYHIAYSGNQYSIDPKTGDYELYAVVDYDAEGGELLGYSDRIMMFPQISQDNTYSVKVTNEYGTYEFYRNEKGDVKIKGFEDSLIQYDQTLFASLCVSCGYPITMQKLDLTSEESNAPKLEDGSIDYSAYGLADVYDEENNLTYTPAVYTVTKAIYADDGTCKPDPNTSYTVKVGDAILSGGGYYVQMEGRSAVYIVSNTISNTVLQPVEAMVTPMISYPTTVATHTMVSDFMLGTVDLTGKLVSSETMKDLEIEMIAAFTYQDLESRENTIFSSSPYVSGMGLLDGHAINDDTASSVLGLFYEMEFISCKKLGLTKEALQEYGFDGNVHYLSFGSPVLDEKNNIDAYMENVMLISPRTENDTFYVASFLYDMIVEVDQYYMSFLEWEQKTWYKQYFFSYNLAYMKDMQVTIDGKTFDFSFDNSESDKTQVNSSKIKVYCDQFKGGKEKPTALDYTITYTYVNDKGVEEIEQVTGAQNFREFYTDLLWFSLEGDFDEAEFEKTHGMSVKDYIAQGDDVCDAKISFHAEDMAATLNDYTYTNESGEEVKLYTENNELTVVLRFYRYTDRKAFLTIEIVDEFDENGDPVSDPTKATGAFYVLSSYLGTLLEDIELVLAQQPVQPEG